VFARTGEVAASRSRWTLPSAVSPVLSQTMRLNDGGALFSASGNRLSKIVIRLDQLSESPANAGTLLHR